jgi:hypothetical protein
MQVASRYRDTEGGKLPAIPVPATTEPLPVRLAHALAVAPVPLTTAELVAVLDATGTSVAPRELEATLRGYRAFVAGRHGWQLGTW